MTSKTNHSSFHSIKHRNHVTFSKCVLLLCWPGSRGDTVHTVITAKLLHVISTILQNVISRWLWENFLTDVGTMFSKDRPVIQRSRPTREESQICHWPIASDFWLKIHLFFRSRENNLVGRIWPAGLVFDRCFRRCWKSRSLTSSVGVCTVAATLPVAPVSLSAACQQPVITIVRQSVLLCVMCHLHPSFMCVPPSASLQLQCRPPDSASTSVTGRTPWLLSWPK